MSKNEDLTVEGEERDDENGDDMDVHAKPRISENAHHDRQHDIRNYETDVCAVAGEKPVTQTINVISPRMKFMKWSCLK